MVSMMAKDGTIRGGARMGAGRKKNSLEEQIADGRANLKVIEMPQADKPPKHKPKKFLPDKTEDGRKSYARVVFKETWAWLEERQIAHLVAPQIIDEYAALLGRFIQCEEELTEAGLIRTTDKGHIYIDPRVKASLDYAKQANNLWYTIDQKVREYSIPNSAGGDDKMERLLRAKRVI